MKTHPFKFHRKSVFPLLSIFLSFLLSPSSRASVNPDTYTHHNTFTLKATVTHNKSICPDRSHTPHVWTSMEGYFSSKNDDLFLCFNYSSYTPLNGTGAGSMDIPLHRCHNYLPEEDDFDPLDYYLILTVNKSTDISENASDNIDLSDPLNPSFGSGIWEYPNTTPHQYTYKISLQEMLLHGFRLRYGCETIAFSLETKCPFTVENNGIHYVGYPYRYTVKASADCKTCGDYTYTPQIFMWEYAHADTHGFQADSVTGQSRVISPASFPDLPFGNNLLIKTADGRASSSKNTRILCFYPNIPQPTRTKVQQIPQGDLYLRNITLTFDRNLRKDLNEELTVITLYKQVAVSSEGVFNANESQVITQHTVNMALLNGTHSYTFSVPPYTVTDGTYYVTVEGKANGRSNNPTLPENDTLPVSVKAAMFQCVPITVKTNEIPIEDVSFTPPVCYGGKGKVKITIKGYFLPFVANMPDFYYKAADGSYVSLPFTCTFTGTQSNPHATFECGDIDGEKTELKLVIRSGVSSGGTIVEKSSSNNAAIQEENGVIEKADNIKKGISSDQIAYVNIDFTQPDPLQVPVSVKDISGYYYENGVRKSSMDGKIVVQRNMASGGKKPYTFHYEQFNNSILGKALLQTDTLNIPFPSLYRLYMEDLAGCTFDTSVSVYDLNKTLWVAISTEREISCHNANDGILRADIKMGTGGRLRYSWYKNNVLIAGASDTNIAHLGPGRYKVVLTDPTMELSSSDEITLSEPEPLTLDIQRIEHIDCFGNRTGGIELKGSGGVAPYLYSWKDGAYGMTRHELPAGTYPVKLIDQNSCLIIRVITLKQPEKPFEIAIDTVIHAYHDADGNYVAGRILAHAQGGTPPYPALSITGNHNLNHLDSGTYELIGRDAKRCEDRKTVKVEKYDRMQTEIIPERQNLCHGESHAACHVQITGGVPPFSILWSNGNKTERIENLSAGTYTVTVTDAAGIVRLSQINLTTPPPLEITTIELQQPSYGGCIDKICPETGNDGRIHVAVKGGSLPYQLHWTKNGEEFSHTATDSSIIENLSGGYYALFVSDINTCKSTADFVLKNISPLKAEIETEKMPGCFDGADGILRGKVSGGTPPYRIEWEGFADTLARLENIKAGMYALSATDALGIKSLHSFLLTEPEPLRITADNIKFPSYPGSENGISFPAKANGSIHISVSGGTPPYRYRWENEENQYLKDGKTGIDSLLPGTFRFRITDSAGCTADTAFSLPYVAPLICSIAVEKPISCFGFRDAILNANITGGIPPYTLQWYKDGDPSGNETVLVNAEHGTYRLDVKDSLHVQASFSFVLKQPDSLSLTLIPIPGFCHGDSAGKAVAVVSGGTLPYTYNWHLDGETQPYHDSILIHLETASISLSVTDLRGCTATGFTSVTSPTVLQAAHMLRPPSYAGSLWKTVPQPVSDGQIRLYATGGTPPYRYQWQNGDTSSLITQADSGLYQVNISDRNNCEKKLSFYLKRTPDLSARLELLAEPLCFGEATANLSLSVQGGMEPYTYDWYRNGKWISEDSVLPATEMRAGLYQVTVRDANGITSRDSLLVNQPKPLSATTYIRDASAWHFKNGEIRVEITGGIPPYQLRWENGSTENLLPDIGRGTYSLEITDAHLCRLNRNYKVNSPDSLLIASFSVHHATENKDNGAVYLNVQGGMLPYAYRWEDAYGNTLQNESGQQSVFALENLSEGIYRFYLSDAGGASVERLVKVGSLSQLEVSLLIEKEIACHGDKASIQIWIQGGTPPYACILETPDSVRTFMQDHGRTMRMEDCIAGTYRISVRDADSTMRSASLSVPQPDPLVVNADIESSEHTDFDGTFVLRAQGGRPPYRYLWNTENKTERQEFVRQQTYWAEVRDANECSAFISLDSVVSAQLRISLSQTADIHCHGEATGALKVSIQNGKPPFRIRWSINDTIEEIRNLPAGEYRVSVEDATGKTDFARWRIREPEILKNLISIQNPSCHGMHDGLIRLQTTGGNGYYVYAWNTGNYTGSLMEIPQGTYIVRTSDRMQCNIIDTIVLTAPARLKSNLHVTPIVCHGETGRIEWFGQGGTLPYLYHWEKDDEKGEKPVIDPALAGIYRLTLRDSNHCIFDTSLHLPDAHLLQYSLENEKALCLGQSLILKADGTDTVSDLEYLWVFPDGSVSEKAEPETQMAGRHRLTLVQNHRCVYRDSILITAFNDSIHAEFWVSSQITAKQSCLLVNLSDYRPDSIVWHIPETAEIVEKEGNYLELRFPEAGNHTVGMTSFKGLCSESVFRNIRVYDALPKSNGNEKSNSVRWRAVPNPLRFTCTLTGESDSPLEVRYHLVRATDGRIIEQGIFNLPENGSVSHSVFNGNEPSGIYILLLEYGLEKRNFKLIKL